MEYKMMEYFEKRRTELLKSFKTCKEAYDESGNENHAHDMHVFEQRIFELDRCNEYWKSINNLK
jgi:hypothetical protein